MQHCDPADLALLALGESPDDGAARSHLDQCEQCKSELRELARVVTVGRSISVDDQPMAPPASVWAGIASELADDRAAGASSQRSAQDSAVVVGLNSRRRRTRWLPTVAAAVSCLVLGGIVGAAVVKSNDGGAGPSPVVVASATLEPLPDGPDSQASAIARVEKENGQFVLQVQANGLGAPAGFYEVWMMDPANSGLVAIGTLNPGQSDATFPLPDGLSMESYNSVDISDEPFDGVPGHSTVSVLRGTLTI